MWDLTTFSKSGPSNRHSRHRFCKVVTKLMWNFQTESSVLSFQFDLFYLFYKTCFEKSSQFVKTSPSACEARGGTEQGGGGGEERTLDNVSTDKRLADERTERLQAQSDGLEVYCVCVLLLCQSYMSRCKFAYVLVISVQKSNAAFRHFLFHAENSCRHWPVSGSVRLCLSQGRDYAVTLLISF